MKTQLGSVAGPDQAEQLLDEGRLHDLGCRSAEAMECYAAVIELSPDARLRAEALRRLGVLHHLRTEPVVARELCEQSCDVAIEAGASDLAADALNALGGFALERGDLTEASENYHRALEVAGPSLGLVAKVEQNLGIIANIQGQWARALAHYSRSLAAYEEGADNRGCAYAHHNLGMIHADQKQWSDADRHYQTSQALAAAAGDRHLGGIALMNRAEVRLAQGDLEGARAGAEQALAIFNQVDARRHRAGAHRLLGMVFRQRGQLALAESHLRSALEIAAAAASPLIEADAAKELAALYQSERRRGDALTCLMLARELYGQLKAAADLVDVDERIGSLQGTLA